MVRLDLYWEKGNIFKGSRKKTIPLFRVVQENLSNQNQSTSYISEVGPGFQIRGRKVNISPR